VKITQTYRNQHDEIQRAGLELAAVMSHRDPIAIRKSLSRLSGLIEVHLALEDSTFYPALLKHTDPEIRRIAKAYQESMGKLAGVYTDFRTRWMRAGAIENDQDGFAKEMADVAGALNKRIDLENTTLYSMVDGLAGVAV
jgi:hemerythrin-like domain-containing protein